MRKLTYRNVPYIDREEEEKFLLHRLYNEEPTSILFIYGPKSSGKTTFVEYIVENILQKDKRFYVNYVNFRRYAIVNYDSFLNIYFKPITEENKSMLAKMKEKFNVIISGLKGEISIPEQGINYMVSFNLYNAMQENKLDPFDLFFDILKKLREKGKTPILIIDEVQELSDIYMNGDIKKRYLLTEFFKFLIGLTKETHLAHIIVCTSSSIFIDEIYNHSNLAKTSDFFLFDHFNRDIIEEWLKDEKFSDEEIELIWEFLGGCPYDILQLLSYRRAYKDEFDLKGYLVHQAEVMRGRISLTVSDNLKTIEEKRYFKEMLRQIIEKDYILKKDEDEMQSKVLKVAINKDILFLYSDKGTIKFNSQIMKKGAEVYLGFVINS